MAKIKELIEKEIIKKDHWLNLAVIESEDVDIIDNTVIWKKGVWEDGTWEGGSWEDGTWERGLWKEGTWTKGTWKDGIWKDGVWKDGLWKGGLWKGGLWKDGFWENGFWEGGAWEGGYKRIGFCKWKVYLNESKNSVKIGCKERTIEEWDEWFASDKEDETKRGTDSFKKIEESYKIARFAIKLEKR